MDSSTTLPFSDLGLFDEESLLPSDLLPTTVLNQSETSISFERAKTLAANFYKALDSMHYQYVGACSVCGMVKFGSEMTKKTYSKSDQVFRPVKFTFLESFNSTENVPVCNMCLQSLRTNSIPKFSLYNMGNIPVSIPSALQDLQDLEKLLLATARPYITLKRLKFGNYAFTGNSVTITQKVTEALTELPMNIDEFSECLFHRSAHRDEFTKRAFV
jgi:hypothetical protein